MSLSPCGINCGEFEACKEAGCSDCHSIQGKPFYIKEFGLETCPMYDCPVNQKGYQTCGECDELPCKIYYDWKDPSMSDEEHINSINERVARLKSSEE